VIMKYFCDILYLFYIELELGEIEIPQMSMCACNLSIFARNNFFGLGEITEPGPLQPPFLIVC